MKLKLDKIKVYCALKNWSLTDLAREVGTSKQDISQMISRNSTTNEKLMGIAKALGINVDQLYEDSEFKPILAKEPESPYLRRDCKNESELLMLHDRDILQLKSSVLELQNRLGLNV